MLQLFTKSSRFLRRQQKLTKSSLSILNLLHNTKSKVKISSIFVAFLENMNFSKIHSCNIKLVSFYWILSLLSSGHLWNRDWKTVELR